MAFPSVGKLGENLGKYRHCGLLPPPAGMYNSYLIYRSTNSLGLMMRIVDSPDILSRVFVSTYYDISANDERTGDKLVVARISTNRVFQGRGIHYQRLCHQDAQQLFEFWIGTPPGKFLAHTSVFHDNLGRKNQLKLSLDTGLQDIEQRASEKRARNEHVGVKYDLQDRLLTLAMALPTSFRFSPFSRACC